MYTKIQSMNDSRGNVFIKFSSVMDKVDPIVKKQAVISLFTAPIFLLIFNDVISFPTKILFYPALVTGTSILQKIVNKFADKKE